MQPEALPHSTLNTVMFACNDVMNYSGPQSCWFNAVLWAQDLRPVSPLSHLVHQEISPNIGAPNVVLL